MGLKIILVLLSILLVFSSLAFYWFIAPVGNPVEFVLKPASSNFNLNGSYTDLQFYPNLRYVSSNISYRIDSCNLQREDEVEQAFQEISDVTVLNFYPVASGEEIHVTCDIQTQQPREGYFVAGEGGPTKIIAGDRFNVIFNGKVLLFKGSQCEKPNIAIHEILHALGFGHSLNEGNIMFNVTTCRQTFGKEIPEAINELYSYPTYADLDLRNISAEMKGKYLDTNITIKNNGLKDSEDFILKIYADDSLVKEMESTAIKIGEGKIIVLQNVLVPRLSVEELKFEIETSVEELDKANNEKILKIKN